MTDTLTALLLRLSESGPGATLSGRAARPYSGKTLDGLVVAGVIEETAEATEWSPCADCDCAFGFRPIRTIAGRIVAACPIDPGSDLELDPEDLREFRIDAGRLLSLIGAVSGLSGPVEVIAPGLWHLGRLGSVRPTARPMPFPKNCPQLQDLPHLPPQEIAALPADVLAILQHESETALKQAKAAKARLDGGLVLKYSEEAAEARRLAGKDTGTVRFDDGDVTVVADLPKRVDWDQALLAAMVERIRAAGDDPADYVEISFKVPERNFAAWPTAIREGFEPARTVRPGQLVVQFLSAEEAR